jgi:hypothetical protein
LILLKIRPELDENNSDDMFPSFPSILSFPKNGNSPSIITREFLPFRWGICDLKNLKNFY